MTASPRNPRTDPKPGDVVRKGTAARVIVRRVLRCEDGTVYYTSQNSASPVYARIAAWKKWAEDATVVETA